MSKSKSLKSDRRFESPMVIDTTYLSKIFVEIIITFIFGGLLVDIIRRAHIKKTDIAKRLVLFMTLYFVAILLTTFNQFNKRILLGVLISDSVGPHFEGLYKIFTLGANYAYFLFYLEVFMKYGTKQSNNKVLFTFTLISIGFTILIPFLGESYKELLNTILAVLLLVHSLIIYIPSLIKSFTLYKRLNQEESKAAVFSIVSMSFFFLILWVVNICNQVWDMVTGTIYGPFWLLSWIIIIIALISGYIGFVNPPWFQKLTTKPVLEEKKV